MSEKICFPETSRLEMTSHHSQSPVFGLAVLYPTGSEISRFWYIKTRGNRRKIAIDFFYFLAILVSTLWRFYRANKAKSVIYSLTQEL